MQSPKLIIFDLDGVLANTEHFYMLGISKALQEQGFLKYTPEYCENNTAGLATPLILEKVFQETGKKVDTTKFDLVIEEHYKSFEQSISIVAGAKKFIECLKIPFCIASSSNISQIKRTLGAIGLDSFFTDKTIFSCFNLKKFKPNPAIYLEVLNTLGLSPVDVVTIEDSPAGVTASVGAEIPTIGFIGADYLKARKASHEELLYKCGAFTVKDNYKSIYNLLFKEP